MTRPRFIYPQSYLNPPRPRICLKDLVNALSIVGVLFALLTDPLASIRFLYHLVA